MSADNVSKVTNLPGSMHTKLMRARIDFARADVKKAGVNRHIEFMYFTLPDIVPVVLELQSKYSFIINMRVDETPLGNALFIADVVNLADTNDVISFTAPFVVPDSAISVKTGNPITTKTQNVGSAITYMRRYLYMMIFDIVEMDFLDETSGKPELENKRPATAETKREVQEKLADKAGLAPKTLITSLTKKLKELKDAVPEEAEFIKQVLTNTDNLKNITREECEGFILYANAALEKAKE